MTSNDTSIFERPSTLRVISYNCWGLKYVSKHRQDRLVEIGRQLAAASPEPSIVGLQECWTHEDYSSIHDLTKHILPHGRHYSSAVFGSGLAILSKWPIVESSMHRYPLNGLPWAFHRGDWFVGKGVAGARIHIGGAPEQDVVQVFCTHMHASYRTGPADAYLCHRTAQAWEIAKVMRHAVERGHVVLGLGDFNAEPASLAHRVVEAMAPVRDVWEVLRPASARGAAEGGIENARARLTPTAEQSLSWHGSTCDSCLNTWRWSRREQRELEKKGRERVVDPQTPDPEAERLDYIFLADSPGQRWYVESVNVGMTMRHPKLGCSLSDHFSVEATLVRQPDGAQAQASTTSAGLSTETYDEILSMTREYSEGERRQGRFRIAHFYSQLAISVGCLTAVWWSPRSFVAFILILVSTLGLGAGVLDGLMGFIFVRTELAALNEFEWEIREAREETAKLVKRNG